MEKFDIKQLTKLYYSIGEVARIFDINPSLIRFWEKEFNLVLPKKNSKGSRIFTPKEIEKFNKIYNLVKIQGYTHEGAKRVLREKTIENKENFVPTTTTQEKSAEQNALPIVDKEEIISRLEAIKLRLLEVKNRQ